MAGLTGVKSTLATNDRIEGLLAELNTIYRTATLDAAMAIGRLIIARLYSGNLAAWRKRGTKDASFRKLVRHPHLPMSAGTLYRSVAIYELCERLETKSWKHVSASHLRLVLPLESDEQNELLRGVEKHGWTVRRLEDEITLLRLQRPPKRSKGGRRAHPRLRKVIQKIEKCLDSEDNLVGAMDENATSSPESTRRTIEALRRILNACQTLERRLEKTLPDAVTEPPPPDGSVTRTLNQMVYVAEGVRLSRLKGPAPK